MRRALRRSGAGLIVLIALLVVARIALPYVVQRYVNKVLSRNEHYVGHVGDVDMALWAGAYEIQDVRIDKRSGRVPVPFFASPRVRLSVEWRALWSGAFVGEIEMDRPVLNFVAGPTSETTQYGHENDWRRTVEALFPVKLNRLEAHGGAVHFRNFHSKPVVDVQLRDVDLLVENLTNSRSIAARHPARAALRAVPMSAGELVGVMRFDPFADAATFDLDLSMRGAALRDFNPFLRAYAGFDVERGTMRLYSELVAENGRFEGYLKPFFEDVDVLQMEEVKHQSVFKTLWEAVVGALGQGLTDSEHDRVATRIPLRGTVHDPRYGFWPTLGNALRNAFIESLVPALEHSVKAPH